MQANAEVGHAERVQDILAFIEATPIEEAKIRNHPVYPERMFCRGFNISLSARSYFQLMINPSKDAAAAEDLAKVAQWYLDNPDKVEDPDSAYWAGEYHSAILAKFGSRGSERPGAIPRDVEELTLEYMWSYVCFWSRLDRYRASLDHRTFQYWASENHWWQEIVTSWGYLLALKDDPSFKDRTLPDGKSIQEHYDATTHYMKEHMRERATQGFLTEISSGGYSMRMQNMWLMIYDLSPDEELHRLAENTLDLWWAFWVQEQVSGERGGGKVRHRRLKGLLPNSETHMIPAWLYFGVGSVNGEHIKSARDGSNRLAQRVLGMLSDYEPDPVIYEMLEQTKAAAPYAVVQRRLGKSLIPYREFEPFIADKSARYDLDHSDNLKYSWVTPNFVLGTVMRPPLAAGAWHPGSAQGWWHGLLIASPVANGFPERVVPTIINNNQIKTSDYYGDQYALQSEGSFMTRRLNDVFWTIDNATLPMGIYTSKGLRGDIEHRGSFIFINRPNAWVAIRAANTEFVLSNMTLARKHAARGDFYKLVNEDQPIIIEVASSGDYESFEAFKLAAENASLAFDGGAYVYASLSGDELTMYDDRSRPLINGHLIDYNPPVAYSSPYVNSDWNSGVVTLTAGGMEKVLDFH